MSYNDGNEHIDFYDKDIDRTKIAEQFAEGDILLRDTLLKLWESGIKTSSCCSGDNGEKIAYINLIMDENSWNLIQCICNYIYFLGDDIELSFVSTNNKVYNTFGIYMKNEKIKNQLLNFISTFCESKYQMEDIKSRIIEYANYLLAFARTSGLECRYDINNKEMMVGFCMPKHMMLFNDNAPLLDDLVDSIKETGNLPLVPMKCSDQSIESLLNIIYPNIFSKNNEIQKK